MKYIFVLFFLMQLTLTGNAQLIINEVSQGPATNQEYVELLVTGTPVCGANNTVDLRGWIIDDNNSWHGSGSGTGIAGGHARFPFISQWANVKIGSLIVIYNDADTGSSIHALSIDTADNNNDLVYIIPIGSSVIEKNTTLPASNGSMTTYNVGGTNYSNSGTWTPLGMRNAGDAFHTVSPANYTVAYHAIGWGNNNTALNVYYAADQGGKVIYMTNEVSNDPFDAGNFVDSTAATQETPGVANTPANAAWITSLRSNGQAPAISFNTPAQLNCTNTSTVIIASSTAAGAIFSWSNGVAGANDTVTAAGTYYVTVSDAGNVCQNTDSITITASSNLAISASGTNTSCGNNNGSATVTVTSGTATGYSWTGGANTATAANLASGTYTVTVTGTGGCSATASVTISATNNLAASATSTNTTCGLSNGTAAVSLISGTATSYLWSTGGTSDTLANAGAGTYTVTVTGAGGCTATASTTINASTGNNVTITTDKTIFCVGDSAQVCAPAGHQSYLWNTGASTNCIYVKGAGNYYVTVTDNGNCTAASNHIAIGVHPQPPVSISVSGDSLLAYNAVTYQWILNGNVIQGANSNVYVAHQSGSYQVQVSDSNGCTATSIAVIKTVTGVNTLTMESELSIYPNPLSSGNWILNAGDNFIGANAEIFDADGRLVYKSEIRNQKSEINLDLAKGIYLLKVNSGQTIYTRKLIRL